MKKRILFHLLTLLSCFFSANSFGQVITTFAGTFSGYSGDGGPATAAELYLPIGIVADTLGNVYIAEFSNHIIRKVNAAGIISTVAGTGSYGYSGDGTAATLAQLNFPANVTLDDTGNLYIADFGNSRIRKVNTLGVITTYAGSGTGYYGGDMGAATAAGIYHPNGVAVDHAGNVYIADRGNHRIRKIDPLGTITTISGNGTSGYTGDGGPATAATVKEPSGMSVDAAGNVYFADKGANCIRKISTVGIITTVAGTGVVGFSGDGGMANVAMLDSPTDVKIDMSGNIYIADDNNHRIRRVDVSGIIKTIAGSGVGGFGGDGGNPLTAQLYNPNGVAVDRSGNVYIADFNNNRVRKVSAVDHAPVFLGGAEQMMTICQNAAATPIDAYMQVVDSDTVQVMTWATLVAPAHGSVVASYTAVSTGGTLYTSGLTYTPASGYSGADSFSVTISDGYKKDTTTIHVTISAAPDAGTITGMSSVCIGSSTTLADTVSGGTWHCTNANATITSSGVITGIANGIDTVVYTVNVAGCIGSTQRQILVGQLLSGTFSGPLSVCTGASVIISSSVDSGSWVSGAAGIATVISAGPDSAVVTGITAGTAVITYSVTNSCGIGQAYDTITVLASPSLTGTLTPASICDGTDFHYVPASVSGASFSWSRDTTLGISNAAQSGTGVIDEILHDTTASTISVTYLVATTAGGCTDTQNVVVAVKPTPHFTSGISDTVCNGQPFVYVPGSTVGGSSFAWTRAAVTGVTPVSDSGVGGVNETLYSSVASFTTVAYKYVITAAGCTDTQAVSLSITPFAAGTQITTHSPSVVCTNTLYQNFGCATPPAAGVSYTWSTAGGAAVWARGLDKQYCLVNFNAPGLAKVYVDVAVAGSHCPSRDSFAAYVNSGYADTATVVYFGNAFTCLQSNDYTYQWGYDDAITLDSTILTGETNQSYLNSAPDFINKHYWVMTEHNSCMQKTYYNTPTGVSNIPAISKAAIVAPNPSGGSFRLLLPSAATEQVKVNITDITGRLVKELTTTTNKQTAIELNAPDGIYILSATTPTAHYTAKITIAE